MASRSQRRHRAENQSFQSFSGPLKSWIGFVEWAGRTPQRDWFRLWAGRTQGWMDGSYRYYFIELIAAASYNKGKCEFLLWITRLLVNPVRATGSKPSRCGWWAFEWELTVELVGSLIPRIDQEGAGNNNQ